MVLDVRTRVRMAFQDPHVDVGDEVPQGAIREWIPVTQRNSILICGSSWPCIIDGDNAIFAVYGMVKRFVHRGGSVPLEAGLYVLDSMSPVSSIVTSKSYHAYCTHVRLLRATRGGAVT